MTNDFNPDAPSQGLGDTIAKITHATGLDKVADTVAKALGQEDCGCDKRRETLNTLFPYKSAISQSEYQFVGDRIYTILGNITVSKDGIVTRYRAGTQALVNSSSPLYPHLKTLLADEKIKLS